MKRYICAFMLAMSFIDHGVSDAGTNDCLLGRCDELRKCSQKVVLNESLNFYVKVAETILIGMYGERVLRQRPWKIVECEDYVSVQGVLPTPKVNGVIVKGGTARIVLAKSDCRVVELSHGK